MYPIAIPSKIEHAPIKKNHPTSFDYYTKLTISISSLKVLMFCENQNNKIAIASLISPSPNTIEYIYLFFVDLITYRTEIVSDEVSIEAKIRTF